MISRRELFLERALEAEIVVDNQDGAAGRVAARALMRARPDGRTLGILDVPGISSGCADADASCGQRTEGFRGQ